MLSNSSELTLSVGEQVSPVTLTAEWPRIVRLLLLASLAAIGSIGNVFMISAVMIDDYLRKRGNTFLVNIALADLLVSGLVVPASAVVILAGLGDNVIVCRFQWFISVLCFLVTMLSLTSVAIENYFRLCNSDGCYQKLTPRSITMILLLFWAVCAITSGLQFADLSFDYCTRKKSGLIPYQATVAIVFVFLPLVLTFSCYVRTNFRVRVVKSRPSFKPNITFSWDLALMRSNMYSFLLFVVFWLPFGVVLGVGTVQSVKNKLFYSLAWLAISKSCVNSIFYCITNRHFRSAYVNLFHYCCCKTTVSFSRRQRPEGIRPSGDVRVHIIPGYNMYCSPQRCREGQAKRCCGRTNGRDIYEL
ncbi:melatonin receptor type 1B-B [Agrilus planipennis]|uniref:Melatonin receptor type 1B-B n=1 Tax=Agrilus planipennis TaxID=224129 RepID=A0A7F5RKV0_AGRPL|nr:melatonin receptor type 1B-B [Agrilus planipennis]